MSVVGRQVVRPVFAVYEYVVQVCNFSIIISSWISVGSETWRLHIVWTKDTQRRFIHVKRENRNSFKLFYT